MLSAKAAVAEFSAADIKTEATNLEAQQEATELVKDEVEDHMENCEVTLRELFSGIRLELMKRKRYVHRYAEVMATLKQEKLTSEFEDLYSVSEEADALTEVIASKPADYLDSEEAKLGVTNFVESNPVQITRQTAVLTAFSKEMTKSLSIFGKVRKTNDKCLIFFLIGACAKMNSSLISDALALIGGARIDKAFPIAEAEEVSGVVECLATDFMAKVVMAKGFDAPALVKNAAVALANLCKLGGTTKEGHLGQIGGSGGVLLALDWLPAAIACKDKKFPEMTTPILKWISVMCTWDVSMAEFIKGGGMKVVTAEITKASTIPTKRLEAALEVLVTLTNSKDEALLKELKPASWIPLLLTVASGHKTVHSSNVHTLVCTALFYFVGKGRSNTIMLEQNCISVLVGCLLPRITSAASAENIGVIFVELLKTTKGEAKNAMVKEMLAIALDKIAFVLAEFQTKSVMQTVYMQVIHKLCQEAPDEKEMIKTQDKMKDAELIVAIVRAMLKNPDDPMLLEQACHCLCSNSRGNESMKEYMADVLEDSFYYGFNLIEVILMGVNKFADKVSYIEAAASASWSVCFKSPKMKGKAAEAGVFPTLKKVVKCHISQTSVLPHIFAAMSNLMANHPPNQLAAGSEGIIDITLQVLDMYQENIEIAKVCLTCIYSCLANQADNVAKYEEPADVTVRLGPEIISEVQARYEKNHKATEADTCKDILTKTKELLEMVTKRDEAREQLKARMEKGKMSTVEYVEMRDDPTTGWFDEEKITVVKRGSAVVDNSGGEARRRVNNKVQMIMLHKHELKFFENPENSKMMWPIDEIQLSILCAVEVEGPTKAAKYELKLETLNKQKIAITFDTKAEATQWKMAIKKLYPKKSAAVECKDAKGKSLSRYIAWQDDCFFIFDTKKYRLTRTFMAERLVTITAHEKLFEFEETVHETLNNWKFEVKDKKEATAWADFMEKAIARKIKEVEDDEAEKNRIKAELEEGEKKRKAEAEVVEAEAAFYAEETERRMIELAEEDDELEEAEKMDELERQEKEAAVEEEKKAEEAARRAAAEAERRRLEEEAAKRARDAKNLQAYIDALKNDIEGKKVTLHEVREKNRPLYEMREAKKNEATAVEEDLIERKKEYDEVLGGRLGQILGDFDFEAVERARQKKELFMDEEDLRQQKLKENESESLAHKAVQANLQENRASIFG